MGNGGGACGRKTEVREYEERRKKGWDDSTEDQEVTVYQTNQHSLISFLIEIVFLLPYSIPRPSVMGGDGGVSH